MIKPPTLFIVDDDDDDKEMLIEIVSDIDNSIRCLSASNGKEALQLLRKAEALPDLIFLDLNMPLMNGKQCLQQLKQDVRLSIIPVIIFSTSNAWEEKEDAKRLGADLFITKPSCLKHLKQELEKIFKQYFTNRRLINS